MQFNFQFDVLTIPTGAVSGTRIVIDGITGELKAYDENDNLVWSLAPDQWFIGTEGGARLTFDPIGGMRIRNSSDILVGVIDQNGYSLRDGTTGNVLGELVPGGLTLHDPNGTDDIVLSTSPTTTYPAPNYKSLTEALPGASIVVPALSGTGTDDLSLGHAVVWERGFIGASTWTPPGGWTEQVDVINTAGGGTLNPTLAVLDPATGAAATFTNSDATYQAGLGSHVIVKGGGAASPSIRSISQGFTVSSGTTVPLSLGKPAGLATGDMLVAFVAMGNAVGTVPIGWTTPDGWRFLGANFLSLGTGSTLSTLAVGAWWKPITDAASEPATYDVIINFGAGTKTLHAMVIAVQNPRTFTGGPSISIGGNPIKRLLAENVLAAASLELVNFTGITDRYNHLQVEFYGQSNVATGAIRAVNLRFNGDAGANYLYQRSRDGVQDTGIGVTAVTFSELDGTVVGHAVAGIVDILEYSSAFNPKLLLAKTHSVQPGDIVMEEATGQWNSASVINAIRILTNNADTTFAAGSVARLYGW